MPILNSSAIGIRVREASSFDMSRLERSHDDDSTFDNPQSVLYSEPLTDRVVTGKFDDDIWIWVIEYIAKSKKELWMLHDVFEMGPQLPDDLGEYTNELVAFRCLAYLVDPNHGQYNVSSDTEPKVEFDLSDSCEYVLQCVLDEIPLADLKPGASELSKWNLLFFVTHKRLYLPKCALELLREASHHESTEAMRMDGGTNDQVIHGHDGQNVAERMTKEGASIPEGPRNGDRLLGDRDETSICETNRCDCMIPDGGEENDGRDPDTDAIILIEDDNEHTAEAEEGYDISNQNPVEGADMSQSPEHDNNEFMAAVGLQMMGDASDRNKQESLSDNVSVLPPETAKGMAHSTAGLKTLGKYSLSEVEEREDPEKVNGQKKLSSLYEVISTDKKIPNHSEKIDGATTEGDSSSPSAYRHLCKQCKKGGHLLLCSSEECPVMIHEKCLSSAPAYDDIGNFYCPPCAFLRASSEYLESKAQVAEAKKKLVTFLDLLNSKLKQNIPSD